MTDPNRPNDDAGNAAQTGEPVVSKPYIMPDDPEEGSVEALAKEAAESRDKMLRTLAEMENLRKRTAKEVADARIYGITGFARDVLDIADNLQRALDAVPAETRELADPILKALIEGVELTERSLLNALEKERRQEIRSRRRKIRSEFSAGDVRSPRRFGCPGHGRAGRAGRLHDRRARVAAGARGGVQGRRESRRARLDLRRDCGEARPRMRCDQTCL